jgi:hypothetical protein
LTCPNCGTSNLDNASICIQCGRPLGAGAPTPAPSQTYTPPPPPPHSYTPPPPGSSFTPPPPGSAPGGPVIPNYLVQSILVTLCCCMPLGIVAIIFAAQVNQKLAAGDVAGAQEASRNAKKFCLIALVAGLIASAIIMALNGVAFLQALSAS